MITNGEKMIIGILVYSHTRRKGDLSNIRRRSTFLIIMPIPTNRRGEILFRLKIIFGGLVIER